MEFWEVCFHFGFFVFLGLISINWGYKYFVVVRWVLEG